MPFEVITRTQVEQILKGLNAYQYPNTLTKLCFCLFTGQSYFTAFLISRARKSQ